MCQLLIDRKSGPCHFCGSAEDVTHLFLQSPTNKSAQLQSPASDRICGNERNSKVFHQVDESDADIGAAPLIFPFGLAEELLLRVKFLLRIGALSFFFFLCNSFCTLIFAVFRVSPLFLPPMALLIQGMFGLQPHRHYSGYTSVAVTIPTTLWRGGLRPQSKHPHNTSVNVSSCLICAGWPQWIRVIRVNKIIQRNGMAWHGIKTRVLSLFMQPGKLLRASNTGPFGLPLYQ